MLINQTPQDLSPGTDSKVSQDLDFKISRSVGVAAVSQIGECSIVLFRQGDLSGPEEMTWLHPDLSGKVNAQQLDG